MISSPQTIRVRCDDVEQDATIAWRHEDRMWVVTIESTAFASAEAREADAFEALCVVRDVLEPDGWRIGVAGAQSDVWPSGMARDQGGGLRAYRLMAAGAGDLVDTFEPVDPASVTTVAEQRAKVDRLFEEMRHGAARG